MGMRERIAFWGQMRSNFEQTGAIQPSSRYLAEAMAAPLAHARSGVAAGPRRILEVGPGTGAVTRAIVGHMRGGDRLDCFEINGEFARFLRQAVRDDPHLATHRDQIHVHHAAAQELDPGERFDFAVCSAPLNNFDADTIDAILGAVLGALSADGTATLFEYVLFPAFRRAVSAGEPGRRLSAAQAAKARWLRGHGRDSTLVLRNVPPARVHQLGAVSDR